jgi:hypothetical protein
MARHLMSIPINFYFFGKILYDNKRERHRLYLLWVTFIHVYIDLEREKNVIAM